MHPVVKKLTSKYHTRNPFELAQCLGFLVIPVPLVGIRGFYQHIKRNTIIYLDNSLDEAISKFVCAHEIAHALLHKDFNRIFMDTRTLSITSKFEVQADQFAVDLIYSDEDLMEYQGCTVPQIAFSLGLPESLVEYRLRSIK